MTNEDLEKLEHELDTLPGRIDKVTSTLIQQEREYAELQQQLEVKEALITRDIINETEEIDGKTKAKYSNAEARNIEKVLRFNESEEIKTTRQSLLEVRGRIAESKKDIEYLKLRFRSQETLAKLFASLSLTQ